jgi:hypothetical protein
MLKTYDYVHCQVISYEMVDLRCCGDFKITYQRRMIRECHLWDPEASYVNFGAMKNIIELSSRRSAWMGRFSLIVGTLQPAGDSKKL